MSKEIENEEAKQGETVRKIENFPSSASGREPTCQSGKHKKTGSIPESGGSPGGGQGNPLQYSCLENSMDRGPSQATFHRVAESDMTRMT